MSPQLNFDKSKWRTVKLGELATEISVRIENPVKLGIKKFVGLEHFVSGDLIIKSHKSTKNLTSATKQFRSGDILFARRNAYLRRASMVKFDGVCSGDAFVLRENHERIISGFLAFIVNSESLWDFANLNAAGTMSKRVKWRDLANYEFLLPPKEQQAEIAKLLWAMDDVIQKDTKVSTSLNRLYVTMIERELLNETGKKITLGELVTIVRGVGYKPQDLLNEYGKDCSILLRANNISKSKINFENIYIVSNHKIKKEKFLLKNDFAICMSNGSKELVGKVAKFVPNNKNVVVGSFCAIIRPKSIIYSDLLEHFFASESYRFSIKNVLSGSSINNLKPSDIESLCLRINENTQDIKQILVNLGTLLDSSKQIDRRIKSSRSLQKSIINNIF